MRKEIICKDCEHHRIFTLDDKSRSHTCTRRATKAIDLVTGELKYDNIRSCYKERSGTRTTECGETGKFFQHTEPGA